jgi:hypothetical protein
MKVISLSFPGRFEDAFLYMGQLFAITENRSVCIYDMHRIARNLEEDDILLDAPTHLFCRNDLLTDESFKKRLRDESTKSGFINAINYLETESVQITPEYGHPVEWDLEIPASIILDLNIYNRRAYIGTNEGLYHLDLDIENIVPIAQPKKRMDAKCVHTTAKYGTINASCGSEGWFSFLDDFSLGINNVAKEKYNPAYSLRTNWLGFDVVNYSTRVSPSLLSSVVSNSSKEISEFECDSEQKGKIVTDINDKEMELDGLFSHLNSYEKFSLDNIQFVSNSSSALFINTYDSGLFALGLNETHSFKYKNKYEGLNETVSSLHTIKIAGGGTIFETERNILLFAKKKFIPIFNDEVISIRTFPSSLHYNNMISITTSDEILLISIFDDDMYN